MCIYIELVCFLIAAIVPRSNNPLSFSHMPLFQLLLLVSFGMEAGGTLHYKYFINSDLVNMDPTNLRALLRSKSDCQLDNCGLTLGRCMCWGSPNQMKQKIMEIRKSTAAAYASATIKPQPFSPISSLTSSTPHSKPVSSPHSDIIPMALEQVKEKKGKRVQRVRGQLKTHLMIAAR